MRLALTPPQAVSHSTALLYRAATLGPRAAFVLGHGAGSDQSSVLLRAVGNGLAERGYPVLTFDFAYTRAGKRRPDSQARLEAAFRDALARARELFAGLPLILGGRSMGGRIASHLAADGQACAGLAFLAYPLHAASRPEKLRTAHWCRLRAPMLFVSGDRDALCDLDVLARERAAHLGSATHDLHLVRGGDHSFTVRPSDERTAAQVRHEVITAIADWADRLDLHVSARS